MRISAPQRYLLQSCAVTLIAAAMLDVSVAWSAQAPSISHAQAQFNLGNFRDAGGEAQQILRANPNNKDARLLQAQVYLAFQQGIAAQAAVEAARRTGADRNATRAMMAEALIDQRKFAEALEEAKAVLVPAAIAGDAARVRGLAYLGLKQAPSAKTELLQAVKLLPGDAKAKLALGQYYANTGDAKNAEAMVDQAMQVAPRSIKAILVKGDLVRSREGFTKALPYFNQALSIDPNNLDALIERASTYTDMRREAEAKQDVTRLLTIAPEHPLGLYLQAVALTRQQKFSEGQALMQRTKGVLDNYPPAMMLQGVIAYEMNNMEQASTFLKKVMEVAPGSPQARRLLGATLLRRNDPDNAIAMLKPLFDHGQADSHLLGLMGSAYARKNDYVSAVKYYSDAVKADPAQVELRTQLSMALLASGQPAPATQNLQIILKSDPKSLQANLMLTLLQLRTHDFKAGLASAQRLTQYYPELPVAYNMLGAAYLGNGNYALAEKNFQTSLSKKADYHEARRNLAQLYTVQKRYEEARRELQKVLETDRGNVRSMLALADVAQLQGHQDEYLQWLQRAVAVNAKALPPRLALANAYLRVGDKQRALNETTAMVRDFPQTPEVIETLGKTQASLGNFTEATTTFSQLVNLLPNSVQAWQLMARSQWSGKKPDEARKSYQRALTITLPAGASLAPKGIVYLDLLNLEAEQGNFNQAITYAGELRRIFPGQNIADVNTADLYFGAKQWQNAAKYYEAAAKIKLDKPTTLKLSRCYEKLGQLDKAAAIVRTWQVGKPYDSNMALAAANVYMNTKNYQAAVSQYQQMLKQNPKDANVLNNLAWALDQIGDPRGLATAEQAYGLAPDAPQVADTLGWIMVRHGKDLPRALLLIQKATDKVKLDPNMQYHLAYALRANGRNKDAIAVLEPLLNRFKVFDSLNEARTALVQLKGR